MSESQTRTRKAAFQRNEGGIESVFNLQSAILGETDDRRSAQAKENGASRGHGPQQREGQQQPAVQPQERHHHENARSREQR